MCFCGESCLRKVGLCGIHPLTQRYMLRSMLWIQVCMPCWILL
ncbi:TPA: hypothetical protein I7243_23000 [Vibrio vulnificus]|nr:hypothetical protein [Vibrio vulnificus]